ncbi:WD40-repeat-containing domain protein [Lineolata rhizophorae]|uniref:WD40-repeat-containing domain protein n=1 Tax=Lineolata rhizophorae TaxID=578093 RepID=A0A6A6NU03_9PEZI|nr:WD40-repeat-containing domain protein [Lineolata rhizophorae]
MAKRKRETAAVEAADAGQRPTKLRNGDGSGKAVGATPTNPAASTTNPTNAKSIPAAVTSTPPSRLVLQIVTGSYERVLHGITASIPAELLLPSSSTSSETPSPGPDATTSSATKAPSSKTETTTSSAGATASTPTVPSTQFADSFLFHAHTSAIRCLAISPPPSTASSSTEKLLLATGSTDERINLYQLSLSAPSPTSFSASQNPASSSSLLSGPNPVLTNPTNRSLGTLLHHRGAITALHFPARAKLLSAAEDNALCVTRVRDWALLSTVRAPAPHASKHAGGAAPRPAGDTAPAGAAPQGVNAVAVHPSLKLMVSVGRGERCMRLWNLVTGKKAGVLGFARGVLARVAEASPRLGGGEGRRVVWDPPGEAFVVAFERGCVLFGMECTAHAVVLPRPRTRVQQVRFLPAGFAEAVGPVLALSTEDGRVDFVRTSVPEERGVDGTVDGPPYIEPFARLGGPLAGVAGRIKDFEVLHCERTDCLVVVTGSSDGAVRVWSVSRGEFEGVAAGGARGVEVGAMQRVVNGAANGDGGVEEAKEKRKGKAEEDPKGGLEGTKEQQMKEAGLDVPQIGRLVGTYETGHRITCLGAYEMRGNSDGWGEGDGKEVEEDEDDEEDEWSGVESSGSDN